MTCTHILRSPNVADWYVRSMERPHARSLRGGLWGVSYIGMLNAGGEPRKGDGLSIPENAPVRFLGTVPHHQMPTLLSAADVLVLSSSFEGLPTVVLESFACGTPVFATAVGDLPRVLIEGRTGFFFDGTSAGLRNLILRRWDSLHSMRQSCVEAAQAFGWDAIADRIAGVYRHAA